MNLLVALFFTVPIFAASEPYQKLELSKQACGAKAQNLLKEWGALDQWKLKFTENQSDKKFQAPTTEFGKWVQVSFKNKKDLQLTQFSEKSTVQITFDPACKTQAQVKSFESSKASEPKSLSGIPYFRDSEIEKIIKSKKPAVFFLWSPHMQISIEALKEIRKATAQLKVPLYALVEPNSDPQSVLRIVKELKIPKSQIYIFDSFDLTLRDFRLHFPSLIVMNEGKFSSPVQKGHETADIYENYIRTHL